MSFLRAYKEHVCSYIFRFDQLDIGAVGRSYALLRLPKIPETRGVRGRPVLFDSAPIDTSTIPYRHQERELARQRRLVEMKAEAENEGNYFNVCVSLSVTNPNAIIPLYHMKMLKRPRWIG